MQGAYTPAAWRRTCRGGHSSWPHVTDGGRCRQSRESLTPARRLAARHPSRRVLSLGQKQEKPTLERCAQPRPRPGAQWAQEDLLTQALPPAPPPAGSAQPARPYCLLPGGPWGRQGLMWVTLLLLSPCSSGCEPLQLSVF